MDKNTAQNQTITRPGNTTTYADGDVITGATPAALQFKLQQLNNNHMILLQHAMLIDSANQATKLIADLWLFSSAPALVDDDNAAWTPLDADLANLLGIVQFESANWIVGDATSGANGNAVCRATALAIPIVRDPQDTTVIHGVLVARNAYVPVSGEVFTVRLGFVGG